MISNINTSSTNLSSSNLSSTQTAPQGTQAASAVGVQGRSGAAAYFQATALPAHMPDLAAGEEVTARVVEQLDSQRFVALIKNNLFTLTLPQGTQLPSATLKLTVSSPAPDLTFTLSQSAQDGQVPAENSAQVQLSPSAQYLTNLLSAAQGAGQGEAGGSLLGAQSLAKPPLLSDAPGDPAKLAQGLAQAVNKSGVFYESHLKSWSEGRLPLESLQQEPQARLLENAKANAASIALDSATQADASQASNRVLSSSAAPQLGQLVQRQLDTLENRVVFLQAMAWPNQQVTMEIQQEQVTDRDAQEEMTERAWTSRLSLDLPALGSVNVSLRLVNGTIQVDFHPQRDTTSQLIRDNSPRLASGMDAAGLNLALMTVQNGEETRA